MNPWLLRSLISLISCVFVTMATKSNLTGQPLQIYTGLDAATSNLLSTALQYTNSTDLTCRNITAAGSESIAGTLNVTGAITAPAISASIANTPTVNATAVNTTNVTASGTCSTVNQTVSGTATINTLSTSGATLGGATNMTAATVSGALSSASLSTGAIAASGGYTQSGSGTNTFPGQLNTASVSASTYTGGTVSVANVSASGTIAASTNLTSPAATITTLGSNTVTATAVNASTLSSSSSSTVNSLGVTNNATVGGTLGVTGTTTVGTVNSNGTVNAANVVATNGTITNLSAGTITATNLSYSGTGTFPSLAVTGTTTTGAITVTGSAAIPNIGSTTTVNGALYTATCNETSANGGVWFDKTTTSISGGGSWASNIISDTVLNTMEINGRYDGGNRYVNLRDNVNVTGSLVVGSAKGNGATRNADGSMIISGPITAGDVVTMNAGATLQTHPLYLWANGDANNKLFWDPVVDCAALQGNYGGWLGSQGSGSLVKTLTWDRTGNAGVTNALTVGGMLQANAGANLNRTKLSLYGPNDPNNVLYYDATADGAALVGWQGGFLGGLSAGSLKKAVTWDANNNAAVGGSLSLGGPLSSTTAGFIGGGWSTGVNVVMTTSSIPSATLSGSIVFGEPPFYEIGTASSFTTWGQWPSSNIQQNGSYTGELFNQFGGNTYRLMVIMDCQFAPNAAGTRVAIIDHYSTAAGHVPAIAQTAASPGNYPAILSATNVISFGNGDMLVPWVGQSSGSALNCSISYTVLLM